MSMKSSESTSKIFTALWAAQSKGLVAVATNKNSQTNSKYANLADIIIAVMPILAENGLAVLQPIGGIRTEGTIHVAGLTTRIIHSSGEWIEQDGEFPLAPPPKSNQGKDILNYSQTHGLALTYARRYALVSALGIATGDDKDASDLTSALQQGSKEPEYQEPTANVWVSLTGGYWFDHDAPGFDPKKLLGELSKDERAKVRREHRHTNPAVLANLWDDAEGLLSQAGLTYETAPKPGTGWPADWQNCSSQQVTDLFAWAKSLGVPQGGGQV